MEDEGELSIREPRPIDVRVDYAAVPVWLESAVIEPLVGEAQNCRVGTEVLYKLHNTMTDVSIFPPSKT